MKSNTSLNTLVPPAISKRESRWKFLFPGVVCNTLLASEAVAMV